ncbi:hypothetical protein KY320_00540 [Candidatus Woesearchaeota archaeon]|nr:hypothetical protein [Candidatus Woesearchaeota archaeon]
MENREVTIKCYKCGRKFTSEHMRYDPMRSGQLACKSCLDRGSKPKGKEESSGKDDSGEELVKYYCIKCNYKFKRKKSARVTICPYCNREGTLTVKTDAESLLKTAGSEFEE